MSIERIAASEFMPAPVAYVDVNQLWPLFEGLAFRAPTIIVGPKGVGKTASVQAWAHNKQCPVITYDCSEDVRRAHLIGMTVLRGNETPFVLGPLTTAVEIANETGKCILALEEVNALTPQMQKALNPLADWRASIAVPECGKVFRLESGAKLWVVGTMNTAVYGGVYALNEDLKSRFRMVVVDYPTPEAESAVVTEVLEKALAPEVLRQVLTLAHETRQRALEYPLSTRDVVQIAEDIQVLGIPSAMRILLGKFDNTDRSVVIERIKSIFGAQVLPA